jgi:hypothetical protein
MTNIVGLTDLNAVGEQAVELSALRAKAFSRHAHRSQPRMRYEYRASHQSVTIVRYR